MRAFGPRNSTYAVNLTYDRHTLIYIYIYYIPPPLTVHFPIQRSMRYQPIFNGLKFMLHRARVLNNVVITTVIEMVEMVEILDGRMVSVQLSE